MGERKMKNKRERLKALLLLPLLATVTFLLLEVPSIYYRYQDQQLLKENSWSKYESRGRKNAEIFFQKMEKFLSCEDEIYMEHEAGLEEDTSYDTVLQLVQELNLLLGGNYKGILGGMLTGYKNASYFTRLYRYPDSYLEVGFFELVLPDTGMHGTILYDTDSYKILWMEWQYATELEGFPEGGMSSALKYYKDVISGDITFIEEPGYLCITPYSEEIIKSRFFDVQEGIG